MGKKNKFILTFVLLTLTVLMVGFQNCSQQNSDYAYDDASLIDGIIGDTPQVVLSKSGYCSIPSQTFTSTDVIYACIKSAGNAPVYCITSNSYPNCDYAPLTQYGWTYNQALAAWTKLYPSGSLSSQSYVFNVKSSLDSTTIGTASATIYP